MQVPTQVRGIITVHTVSVGEVLGLSWLISPHKWNFNAVALEDVQAYALDGHDLREKSEANTDFGYDLLKDISGMMSVRIASTIFQLLDVYNVKSGQQRM